MNEEVKTSFTTFLNMMVNEKKKEYAQRKMELGFTLNDDVFAKLVVELEEPELTNFLEELQTLSVESGVLNNEFLTLGGVDVDVNTSEDKLDVIDKCLNKMNRNLDDTDKLIRSVYSGSITSPMEGKTTH